MNNSNNFNEAIFLLRQLYHIEYESMTSLKFHAMYKLDDSENFSWEDKPAFKISNPRAGQWRINDRRGTNSVSFQTTTFEDSILMVEFLRHISPFDSKEPNAIDHE